MIIWLSIAPGQGYHLLMKPNLEGKRSLYIGPSRPRIRSLQEEWEEYNVTYVTPFALPKISVQVDQVLIEELSIRYQPGANLRQSKSYHNVVDFLRRHPDVPVLFRPRFGQWNHYPRLCSDLSKPIQRAVTQEVGNITTECVQLKHRLGELGLFQTMQEMEKVVTSIGYEIAEKITK